MIPPALDVLFEIARGFDRAVILDIDRAASAGSAAVGTDRVRENAGEPALLAVIVAPGSLLM